MLRSVTRDRPTGPASICCLSCGYRLDGLDFHRCPECGEPFDPNDPQTWRRVLSDPVRIYRGPIAEVVSYCIALENSGIPARVERETTGVIAHAEVAGGSLYVERTDQHRAIDSLGLIADKIAEADASAAPAADWTCPACGEEVEADFEICWNCQSNRPG